MVGKWLGSKVGLHEGMNVGSGPTGLGVGAWVGKWVGTGVGSHEGLKLWLGGGVSPT